MNGDAFRAVCRTGGAEEIVLRIGGSLERLELALKHIPDDDTCARVVLSSRNRTWCGANDMFFARSLAFYLKTRDTVFNGWTPTAETLYQALHVLCKVDAANKVEYLLTLRLEPSFHEPDAFAWGLLVQNGLTHRNAAVRVQMPGVMALIAVFLLRLPPRVQCRVVRDAATWHPLRREYN